jgi:DNA-directed RNA polymerase specialized sigma24 family protein
MSSATDEQHGSPRDVALQSARRLHAAMTEVVEVFTHQKQVADALVAVLATDTPMTALVGDFAVTGERERMAAALTEYETCRRETRIAIWKLLQLEGCSIGEISRMFGVSRQLVSRQLLHSAQDPSKPTH